MQTTLVKLDLYNALIMLLIPHRLESQALEQAKVSSILLKICFGQPEARFVPSTCHVVQHSLNECCTTQLTRFSHRCIVVKSFVYILQSLSAYCIGLQYFYTKFSFFDSNTLFDSKFDFKFFVKIESFMNLNISSIERLYGLILISSNKRVRHTMQCVLDQHFSK